MGLGETLDRVQGAIDGFFDNGSGGGRVGGILLGDIKIEIAPERKIDFSGLRAMVKYDVPGDRPRYQDMGREERTVRWNGIFCGDGAYQQALALQAYYDSGANSDSSDAGSGFRFIFGEISCRVLIKSYTYQYHRADKVLYEIELVRLESDYDQAALPVEAGKVGDVAKAKNALSKLKDGIKQGMQVVHDVSRAARMVNDTLFRARAEYLQVTKLITSPVREVKEEIGKLKQSFDRTLGTVRQSVGQTSTPTAQKELKEAFLEIEQALPLAEQLVLMAEQESYGGRLDALIGRMRTRRVYAGDTLRSVSTEVYGYPHKWAVLAQINHLPSAEIPAEVKEIRIPDVSCSAELEELLDAQRAQLPQLASTYLPIDQR